MNKVIRVDEECHGFIGLVDKEENIVDFLCDNGWLDENSYFASLETDSDFIDHTLLDIYGENWKQVLKSFSFAKLQDFLYGSFYFNEEEIYTKEKNE